MFNHQAGLPPVSQMGQNHPRDVLKLEHASQVPLKLVSTQIVGPTPRVSDPVGLGREVGEFAFQISPQMIDS